MVMNTHLITIVMVANVMPLRNIYTIYIKIHSIHAIYTVITITIKITYAYQR